MTDRSLHRLVQIRAGNRCEYCHLPLDLVPLMSFHVEHIIPRKHGGDDDPDNLCLACFHCNLRKGSNLAGLNEETGRTVRLFHPRFQSWNRHFRWDGPTLIGRTAPGRATIAVLGINLANRIELRQALIDEGLFLDS